MFKNYYFAVVHAYNVALRRLKKMTWGAHVSWGAHHIILIKLYYLS